MPKVGRYTAALLMVTVGVFLLLDQTTGTDYTALLLQWWPVLLITLGLEYILFNFIYRRGERQLRIDIGGLVLSILLSAAVVAVTQGDRIPAKWLQSLDFNIDTLKMSFSSESGYSYEKDTVHVPLANADKVIFDNPNGSVDIKSGPVTDMEIKTVVWVDKVEEPEARSIAEQSSVQFTAGGTVRITASGQEYTGGFTNKRKPRMNLTVTVPADKAADYDLQLRNGRLTASLLKVKSELKAHTTNGNVTVTDIGGNVTAGTTNGAVEVSGIGGNAKIDTTNGTVSARDIAGKLSIDTTNGAVNVERAGGALEVSTTNGRITVKEAAAGIKAEATNGIITVNTHTVGGNYVMDNRSGSIELRIPADADAEVRGSANGTVSTNLPLTVENKKISGKLGGGKFLLKLDTNSKIEVNRID